MSLVGEKKKMVSTSKNGNGNGGKLAHPPAPQDLVNAAQAMSTAAFSLQQAANTMQERLSTMPPSTVPPSESRKRIDAPMPEVSAKIHSLWSSAAFTNTELTQLKNLVSYEIKRRGHVGSTTHRGEIKVGDKVFIRECSHNPKYAGLTGVVTVSSKRRVRAFVHVNEFPTPAYCFISELEKIGNITDDVTSRDVITSAPPAPASQPTKRAPRKAPRKKK